MDASRVVSWRGVADSKNLFLVTHSFSADKGAFKSISTPPTKICNRFTASSLSSRKCSGNCSISFAKNVKNCANTNSELSAFLKQSPYIVRKY